VIREDRSPDRLVERRRLHAGTAALAPEVIKLAAIRRHMPAVTERCPG
jgi:hypothetical protein